MNSSVWKNVYLILMAAWRQRYLILVPMLIMPVIGGLIAMTRGKVFDTHTTILVQETSKLNPFLEDFSVSTNLSERMAALDTLLHSRHVLFSVAEELELFDVDASELDKNREIKRLSAGITLTQKGKDLVQISFRDSEPEFMEKKLQVVSKHFIEQLLAPERSSIRKSGEFMQQQINIQRLELLESEKKLSEFKQNNAADLPAFHGGNVKRLRELRQALAAKQIELSGAKAELESLDDKLSSTNPVVGALEKRIVNLTSDLELLRARYTENHSKVIQVSRQLTFIQEKRNVLIEKTAKLTPEQIERLWNLAMSNTMQTSATNADGAEGTISGLLVSQLEEVQKSRTRMQRLEHEIASIKDQIQAMDSHVKSYASIEQQLTELERDLSTKQSLYDEFLKRYEMARVTGSLGKFEEKNRIKIIDEPYTPSWPSNLPAMLFVIAGLFGGLALGIGLATLLELMDNSIRRVDQLQEITSAPVLSRIPKIKGFNAADTIFEESV